MDDLQVDLEKEKTMVNSLQNQQKKFDATLNKERERADGLEADKDAYEKKCRDLESKVLSLQAELEDNNEKLSDSERIRKQVGVQIYQLQFTSYLVWVAIATVDFCLLLSGQIYVQMYLFRF